MVSYPMPVSDEGQLRAVGLQRSRYSPGPLTPASLKLATQMAHLKQPAPLDEAAGGASVSRWALIPGTSQGRVKPTSQRQSKGDSSSEEEVGRRANLLVYQWEAKLGLTRPVKIYEEKRANPTLGRELPQQEDSTEQGGSLEKSPASALS